MEGVLSGPEGGSLEKLHGRVERDWVTHSLR
jgi:hypothetical protein